jgi:hypothetical protein
VQVGADKIVTDGPLFCLPKAGQPGQPGQWCILSDMRLGGQNEAIGAGPTVFPKSSSILDQMYTGRWSAVIDASKFFYQFLTRKDERKYLGCVHPRWANLFYVYCGLPMGAGNSPSFAGRCSISGIMTGSAHVSVRAIVFAFTVFLSQVLLEGPRRVASWLGRKVVYRGG